MRNVLLAASVVSFGLQGCGGDGDTAAPPDGAGAPTVAVQGLYAVESSFDVSAAALAPTTGDPFVALKSLRRDPAGTFFKLLADAGVPLARQLQDALPGVLLGRLNGWINDFVAQATFQGRPVTAELDLIIAAGTSTLVRFDLLTDLDLGSPDGAGRSLAAHGVRGLRFPALFGAAAITVPTLPASLAAGITEARPVASIGAGGAEGEARLTLGDHAFGLPLGEYAFAALNLALRARFGQDLRGALGLLVPCAGLAASVAGQCLGPLCVGREDELTQICTRGLDEVVDSVRERLLEHDFKAVHFLSGTADLTATAAGAAADRIDRGSWKANLDVGMGERAVLATFRGARR